MLDITYIRVNVEWKYSAAIIAFANKKIVNSTLSKDVTAKNRVGHARLSTINLTKRKADFLFY
ncbi:MAG: hypothetical protein ACJA1Z_002746 [Patiriisocius sp.]